jgi:hypothetical protein
MKERIKESIIHHITILFRLLVVKLLLTEVGSVVRGDPQICESGMTYDRPLYFCRAKPAHSAVIRCALGPPQCSLSLLSCSTTLITSPICTRFWALYSRGNDSSNIGYCHQTNINSLHHHPPSHPVGFLVYRQPQRAEANRFARPPFWRPFQQMSTARNAATT